MFYRVSIVGKKWLIDFKDNGLLKSMDDKFIDFEKRDLLLATSIAAIKKNCLCTQ